MPDMIPAFWLELDVLFAKVQRMGFEVIQAPGDLPWGHRDFMVADHDRKIVWVTVPVPNGAG
jgi:uncharacterized glyoxalase superfamily protein PhnB